MTRAPSRGQRSKPVTRWCATGDEDPVADDGDDSARRKVAKKNVREKPFPCSLLPAVLLVFTSDNSGRRKPSKKRYHQQVAFGANTLTNIRLLGGLKYDFSHLLEYVGILTVNLTSPSQCDVEQWT